MFEGGAEFAGELAGHGGVTGTLLLGAAAWLRGELREIRRDVGDVKKLAKNNVDRIEKLEKA